MQHKFDLGYSVLKRDVLLKRLSDAIDTEKGEFFSDTFLVWAKLAIDDMDSQYLRIRAARKTLFDHDDTKDFNRDIDLELQLCDEMANWNFTEPKITVEPKPRNFDPASKTVQDNLASKCLT